MRKNEDNFEKKYVKIWGEHINLTRFLLGLIISIAVLALVLMIVTLSYKGANVGLDAVALKKLEDEIKTSKLVYGLIGLMLSFGFNIKFIRPKRNVHMKEVAANDN